MSTDATAPASERAEADTVSCTVAEQIAWVKFSRPEKRNCMSPKLNRQMMRVLDEMEFRPRCRRAGLERRRRCLVGLHGSMARY
jgi:1,4-dihydroxy-2-naphthoyl-CoA synthase